jgi:hypothetical protein
VSQARTRVGPWASRCVQPASRLRCLLSPESSVGGSGAAGRGVVCGWWVEPGVPAERERAVDQGLVAADRGSGAGLEASPSELVSDMLVALLDPVPDPVQPDHLGEVGLFLELARVVVQAAGPGSLVARYQLPLSGKVCGSVVATTSPVGRRWSTRSRCARRGTGAVPGSSRRGRRACPRTRPGRRLSGVRRVSWGTATPGYTARRAAGSGHVRRPTQWSR